MANKYLKGCSKLPLAECILKPQWNNSIHLSKWLTFLKCWVEYREIGSLTHCQWQSQSVKATLENNLAFVIKQNIQTPYHSAVALQGIYSREIKTMFTQKLFLFNSILSLGSRSCHIYYIILIIFVMNLLFPFFSPHIFLAVLYSFYLSCWIFSQILCQYQLGMSPSKLVGSFCALVGREG